MGGCGLHTVPAVVLHRLVSEPKRPVQPASLKWQDDGELSPQDVFNLVCRLREVEPGDHSNELWRLSHKYPSPKPPAAPDPEPKP
ncbi:MAG: hypothetical protein RLZZ168_1928 [Cyanobacteriota bacterium]|jgi:hypothetical protein